MVPDIEPKRVGQVGHRGRGLCNGCYATVVNQGWIEDWEPVGGGGTYLFVAQPWADRALCAQTDPEAFFPDRGGSTAAAKAVCRRCEVRELCLRWALDTDEHIGVWGGLSERDRRKLKRTEAA